MFKKEFMYFCAMVLPKFCDTKDLSKGIINVIITFLDDLVERSMLPPKVDLSTFYGTDHLDFGLVFFWPLDLDSGVDF